MPEAGMVSAASRSTSISDSPIIDGDQQSGEQAEPEAQADTPEKEYTTGGCRCIQVIRQMNVKVF